MTRLSMPTESMASSSGLLAAGHPKILFKGGLATSLKVGFL